MSEKLKIDVDKPSMFNNFLLDANVEAIQQLCQDVQNGDEAEIELYINGKEIRVAKFNEVMQDWVDRIGEMIKIELDYFKEEEAIRDKAKQLIEAKLGHIEEIVNDLRLESWDI